MTFLDNVTPVPTATATSQGRLAHLMAPLHNADTVAHVPHTLPTGLLVARRTLSVRRCIGTW